MYRVKLATRQKGCWIGEILDKRLVEAQAPLPVSLALPCLRGDRWETALETACELGVREVWLVDFAQSALRWSKSRRERAERKAIEALKQSGGSRLTLIQGPCSLEELVAQPDAGEIWAAHASGDPLPDLRAPVLLLIGPEAGFAEAEIKFLNRKHARFFTLGSRRLRTEIAATVALAQAASRLTGIG
jgi:16S rRNA (uracil1498-N3)-methyltransferase